MVQPIQTEEEFNQIIKTHKTVVIDCYADWCGPCRMISPEFERLAEERKDNEDIGFYKLQIDADELLTLVQRLGIGSVPTFLAFRDGVQVDQFAGAYKQKLQDMVQTYST